MEETATVTIDAFHRGGFWLAQPAGRGHRAGMDAMVLAAAVPSGFDGGLADLGAGAGAAGFAVAARCPDADVTLVERDPAMAGFAERSIGLAGNRHLNARVTLLRADVSLAGKARTAVGLADRSHDFVIMNPPFNDGADRQSPDEMKRDAHVMDVGMFAAWTRTAAAMLRPGGGLALIARPASLAAALDAAEGRFGALALKPVHPHAGRPAIRFVLRGVLGSRAGLSIHPPLVLHDDDRREYTAEADAICNGAQTLFGD
ncbi:MAG: methyltransferase [Rhizobiaceae bacterium]